MYLLFLWWEWLELSVFVAVSTVLLSGILYPLLSVSLVGYGISKLKEDKVFWGTEAEVLLRWYLGIGWINDPSKRSPTMSTHAHLCTWPTTLPQSCTVGLMGCVPNGTSFPISCTTLVQTSRTLRMNTLGRSTSKTHRETTVHFLKHPIALYTRVNSHLNFVKWSEIHTKNKTAPFKFLTFEWT